MAWCLDDAGACSEAFRKRMYWHVTDEDVGAMKNGNTGAINHEF